MDSKPKERTHDISLANYHIKDLKAFGETLTDAVAGAFPNKGKSRYSEVHVLLLSWEEDNLGVITEVAELRSVFCDIYRFDTEEWKIPSNRSHNSLAFKLMGFLEEYDSKDSLLIVYYGGHGGMNDDRQCVWSCTDKPKSPVVQWFGLQTMLEQAKSDAFILLDCCAAASSAAGLGSGITEVIAACGFETMAPGVGQHSFTRSLIDELKYLSHGTPFSVAVLHNKVLSRIKYWKPRFNNAGPHEHRRTPVYILLANEAKQRSIELAPLPYLKLPIIPSTSNHNAPHHPSLSSSGSPGGIEATSAESSQSSLHDLWPDHEFKSPKVLISVSLEEDQTLETSDLIEWFQSIPALVKFAHIEGIYKSDSTLIILSISVAVWDLLLNDVAVSFIGFVRSSNLLRTGLLATKLTKVENAKSDDLMAQFTAGLPPSPEVRIACVPCLSNRITCDGIRPSCNRCNRDSRKCSYNINEESTKLELMHEITKLQQQIVTLSSTYRRIYWDRKSKMGPHRED